ncbi:MAG: phosphoenolpyruvate-protein phosphotransferase [Arenicella sp.]|jgi:phosphoenolpyruvate-protein phosphotransferase
MRNETSGNKTILLTGKMLSPGMGSGKVFIYRDILGRLDEFYDIEESEIVDELERFSRAVAKVSDDLDILVSRVSREMDDTLSDIFSAHIAMVQDPSLTAEVKKEINEELVSAGSAVKIVFRRWEHRFQRMEMEVAKHKADDVRDLARRLITSLAGVHSHLLEKLPEGSILIARRLLPSDTVYLARQNASGAIIEYGGAGSHAALFAREIGLPCITGIPNLLETVPEDGYTLLDADSAKIVINPEPKQQEAFESKFQTLLQHKKQARKKARQPAVTKSGQVIGVYANVSCVDDTRKAVYNGADGIGLYRIEQVFLGRQTPPDISTLVQEISKTLEPAKHLPVTVRLLDAGADKPLPFMESLREINPALGQRGIRFLQTYPDLLRNQLTALLQLSTEFDLHILVPMVTLPEDIDIVKQQLLELASESGIALPKLGAMIETPAAALSLREIATCVDIMSFGTNDLTQYTFATDRENAAVERYFDDTHEAIFRLFEIAHQDLPEAQFSVCGELAGRPESTSRLLQYGVRTLSVAPPLIPSIKQAVRQS